MKFSKKQKVILASLVIFFSAFLFRWWGIRETGGTWDEDIYYNSAYHYYFNFKSLDFSRASWGWNFEHPPVAKYLYLPGAWLSQKLPPDPAFRVGVNYLPLRVESALMGALTCVLVFLIGFQIFKSFWGGVFAGIILAFLPQFAAYGKLVSLESPQTLFLTAALYFFLRVFAVSKAKGDLGGGKGRLVWGGLALASALAFSTRYSSGLVFGWMGLVLLAKAFGDRKKSSFATAFLLPSFVLLFSLLFLFSIWPWLWHRPVQDFVKSFSFSGQHFGGEGLKPLYYFKYLLFTTPLLVVVLALFGAAKVWAARQGKRMGVAALLLWVLVFAGQGLTGLKGGGVRYALMALPAVAILAGLGASQLRITNDKLRLAIAGILAVYLLANSVTVYPYLMDYYSESVGLVWGAGKIGLSFGFRGEGIKRTVAWLNDNAVSHAKVAMIATPDEAPPLRSDLEREANPTDETCYIVALPPYLFKGGREWELLYEEKVAGVASLSAIYENTDCKQ